MANDQATIAQMSEYLGRTCHWLPPLRNGEPGDIGITCTIKDARYHFGRFEVQVQPSDGYGRRWVWLDHCELI